MSKYAAAEVPVMYDKVHDGYRVFVGELGSRAGKYELEKEFEHFGPVIDVWVAR